jgi:hypothetical protein
VRFFTWVLVGIVPIVVFTRKEKYPAIIQPSEQAVGGGGGKRRGG